MAEKFIIIEPFLKNQSGHQFGYTLSLQEGLKKRGIETLVLGNIDADQTCREIEGFNPCLTELTTDILKNLTAALLKFPFILVKMHDFAARLDNFITHTEGLAEENNVIWFTHSLYIFEYLPLAWFFRKHSSLLKQRNHRILLGLNFDYRRNSRLLTEGLVFLYRHIFKRILNPVREHVRFFTDCAKGAEHMTRLMDTKVYPAPVPLYNDTLNTLVHEGKQSKEADGKLSVYYIGGARVNKGFELLPELLQTINRDTELKSRLSFMIQIDIHPQQVISEQQRVTRAADMIRNLASKSDNIRIIHGSLSHKEYYQSLIEGDIFLLLYSEISFTYVQSQIFREIICLGNIPLVSRNTIMANELHQHGLDELIVDPADISGIVETIRTVTANMSIIKEKMKTINDEWKLYFSSTNVANSILDLANSIKPVSIHTG